jgi:short-subunit dehydrogenase
MIGPIEEATIEQATALFDANVLGPLRLCRAVLPIMRGQRSGRIVNVSSAAATMPVPYMGLYSATKCALEALSEALDHEVRGFGIRVAVVQLSYVRTNIDAAAERGSDMLQAYSTERSRMASYFSAKIAGAPDPSDSARVIERAIWVDRFQRLSGSREAQLVNAMRRWLPAALVDRAVRHSLGLDRRQGT